MKASHTFNLLDARKAISVTERQRYILRVRTLARAVAQAYYDSREALGFPMLTAARGGAGMNDSARDFLVELGTEELPPLALPELERAFAAGIRAGLDEAGLPHGELRSFATPRRLAVLVRDSPSCSPRKPSSSRARPSAPRSTRTANRRRPRRSSPRSAASTSSALTRVTEGKGEFLFFAGAKPGVATGEPAAGDRAAVARCAADSEAHALGLVERRVRAARCTGSSCCSAPTSCPRASSTPTRAARRAAIASWRRRRSRSPNPADYENVLREQGKVIAGFRRAPRARSARRSWRPPETRRGEALLERCVAR